MRSGCGVPLGSPRRQEEPPPKTVSVMVPVEYNLLSPDEILHRLEVAGWKVRRRDDRWAHISLGDTPDMVWVPLLKDAPDYARSVRFMLEEVASVSGKSIRWVADTILGRAHDG